MHGSPAGWRNQSVSTDFYELRQGFIPTETLAAKRANPQAKLLIIGEAPGPEENVKGKPFVGRAGQLLDKILQAAEFDPEKDVYITNSVFRLPPGEDGKSFRKPTDEEIKYYRPYVLEIIRLVDPLIMLVHWESP